MAKKNDLKQLEEKLIGLEGQLKRAVADYQNLEKRVAEGRSELSTWATANLVKDLLTVLDHLEKALTGASEEEKKSGWYKGVEMAVTQFKAVLKEEGLDEIGADGQFDPSLHEAVDIKELSSAETTAGKGENSILEVVKKGYNLNGKVLRPAQVVVGKGQGVKEEDN